VSTSESTIYFDNNATTAVADECIEAMNRVLRLGPVNPSSKHALGDRAKQIVMEARAKVAGTFGVTPAEVVFTSSATEANHLAILGALSIRPERRHVIASAVEHPSTLMLLRYLETQGVRVSYVPVDGDGQLMLDALEDLLAPDTALVSLMWANNETGVLFPIARAAEIAHARGVLFHTDAVQAAGREPIDLRHVGVDLLSISGHKLHAPTGIGALCVRKAVKVSPILFGHQERGRRGGTENVAGIAALGTACELAAASLATTMARLLALRNSLEAGVLRIAPYARVNGARAPRIANTSSISFGRLDSELILAGLDRLGIYASPGAACTSAGTKPSHVLTAMGLSATAALASVRFSLGRQNTQNEVDHLLSVLPDVLTEPARRTA
jgi:cysteine desulfurase